MRAVCCIARPILCHTVNGLEFMIEWDTFLSKATSHLFAGGILGLCSLYLEVGGAHVLHVC